MPITPEQAEALAQAERYEHAQASAFDWMQRAEAAEDAGERDAADRALEFAATWTQVAVVLVPPLEPIECELTSTDG